VDGEVNEDSRLAASIHAMLLGFRAVDSGRRQSMVGGSTPQTKVTLVTGECVPKVW